MCLDVFVHSNESLIKKTVYVSIYVINNKKDPIIKIYFTQQIVYWMDLATKPITLGYKFRTF